MTERVMLDIETLGLEPGASILSIGAVKFDTDGLGERIHRSVGLRSCEAAGLTIDAETLQWWLDQDDADSPLTDLLTQGMPLEGALEQLARFCYDADEVWAKAPKFDCTHLEHAADAVGVELPWEFYELRDVRTIAALPIAPEREQEGTEHDALDDAVYQARIVAETLRRLEDGDRDD
jgi:inhibitor of KinA sporulation pathway (predicted exonuclease)